MAGVLSNPMNNVYREVEGKAVRVQDKRAFGAEALGRGVNVLHEVSPVQAKYLREECGLDVKTKDAPDGKKDFMESPLTERPLRLGPDEGKKGAESFRRMLDLYKSDDRYEL